MKRAKEIGPSRRISPRITSIKTALPEPVTHRILSIEWRPCKAPARTLLRQGRADLLRRGFGCRHQSRDRVAQAVPVNRLGQMLGKTGGFARRQILVRAVTTQRNAP